MRPSKLLLEGIRESNLRNQFKGQQQHLLSCHFFDDKIQKSNFLESKSQPCQSCGVYKFRVKAQYSGEERFYGGGKFCPHRRRRRRERKEGGRSVGRTDALHFEWGFTSRALTMTTRNASEKTFEKHHRNIPSPQLNRPEFFYLVLFGHQSVPLRTWAQPSAEGKPQLEKQFTASIGSSEKNRCRLAIREQEGAMPHRPPTTRTMTVLPHLAMQYFICSCPKCSYAVIWFPS